MAPAQSVRANLWRYASTINQCAFPQTCAIGRYYEAENGTSWAAPGATGAASVLARFISKTYNLKEPSPALMKAYMVHTAKFLRGLGTGSTPASTTPMRIPSPVQGYGRVNLDFGFDTSVPRYFIDQSVVFDDAGASGDTFGIAGRRVDPAKPFRAVLVWTDHPANTCSGGAGSGAIFNNLDLSVYNSTGATGNLARGNRFSATVGQEDVSVMNTNPGGADAVNNVEAIFLPAGFSLPGGTQNFFVQVKASQLVMDGISPAGEPSGTNCYGTTLNPRQDFALVLYNFEPLASPAQRKAGLETVTATTTGSNFKNFIFYAADPSYSRTPTTSPAAAGTGTVSLSSRVGPPPEEAAVPGLAFWGRGGFHNPEAGKLVRIRSHLASTSGAAGNVYMRMRFGASNIVDEGYHEYLWQNGSPHAPSSAGGWVPAWFVPAGASDWAGIEEPIYAYDMIDSDPARGTELRIGDTSSQSGIAVDSFELSPILSAAGTTVLYTRGGAVTGTLSNDPPVSPFGFVSTDWVRDGASQNYHGSIVPMPTGDLRSVSPSAVTVTLPVESPPLSGAARYIYAVRFTPQFTMQSGRLYVARVYIRNATPPAPGQHFVQLRMRWHPVGEIGGVYVMSAVDLDSDNWKDFGSWGGVRESPNAAGLSPGGGARVFTAA